MPDKTMLDWALEYAAKGFHVFPCHYVLRDGCSCHKGDCGRVGKHPITKNGVLDATTDPEQIRRWWAKNKNYNLAIATGHDGLVVIDADTGVDERDGRVKMGPENLAKLGALPPTLQQRTGSGGFHYFFRSDKPIKNDNKGAVAQDVDVRGKSGYVVVPPSNHKSGGRYEWLNEGTPIAPMPEWLEALCPHEADAPKLDASQDAAPTFDDKDLLKGVTKDEVRKLLRVIPADDRDTWWKIGAALKTEYGEDGFDIWDEWSRTCDKYQANVQKVQWQSFRPGEISAGSIFHFAKENGWRGWDREAADDPQLKENWVHCWGTKRFIELCSMDELDREQFSCRFAPMFKRGLAADHVLRNENFPRYSGVTYWPNQPQIVTDVDGRQKVNMWQASGLTAAPGDVAPFVNHVQYLFPDPKESAIVLDYLAYQVQQPGRKVHWALLIQGVQGNGKSFLGQVMRHVLGSHNVRMMMSDTLHETFTGWLRNTQFIVVEELMARGRMELMNKLKPLITEPWVQIREMYKPPYEQANRFNFLFLTNHLDPIVIDDTDRRYCVLYSPAPPHPDGPDYYRPLFEWASRQEGASALLDWMMHRDLSRFQAQGHAPMTAAKRELIERSLPALDYWIKQTIESGEWPFSVDLVSSSDLAEVLPQFGLRGTPKDVGAAFARLKCNDLSYRRVGPNCDNSGRAEQKRLWAVRNYDKYKDLTTEQLRQVWLRQTDLAPKEDAGLDAAIIEGHRTNMVKATRPGMPNVVKETRPM
jgi:hypothetical protein